MSKYIKPYIGKLQETNKEFNNEFDDWERKWELKFNPSDLNEQFNTAKQKNINEILTETLEKKANRGKKIELSPNKFDSSLHISNNVFSTYLSHY